MPRGTLLVLATASSKDGRTLMLAPVEQPLFVFGSVVALLFFAGLRRAWRPSHVIPLGIYLFLLLAYAFKGALGSARYYESLMPFVALSAAHGARSLAARWRGFAPALFLVASLQLVALSTQLFLWTWPSSPTPPASPVAGALRATSAREGGDERTFSTNLPQRDARTSRR